MATKKSESVEPKTTTKAKAKAPAKKVAKSAPAKKAPAKAKAVVANTETPKNFLVVKSGGKQYIVTDGTVLRIEKLNAQEGETVVFDEILMAVDDKGTVTIGTPFIEGMTVKAVVEGQGRAKKVRVVHFKSKSNRHKTYGHRQPFTKVKFS